MLAHPKVVNAAYFSPVTGNKIMTTCIDNRWGPFCCDRSSFRAPAQDVPSLCLAVFVKPHAPPRTTIAALLPASHKCFATVSLYQ